MSALDMLEKLHADLIRQRREVDSDLKRLADAYHAKLVEYRKLSHGIIGIENEIENFLASLGQNSQRSVIQNEKRFKAHAGGFAPSACRK